MKTPVLRPRLRDLWPRTGSQCGSNPAKRWIHSDLGNENRGPLENAALSPPRQPRDKAGFAEPFHHVLEMRAVSRFDDDFEQGALGRQVGEGALMRDFD